MFYSVQLLLTLFFLAPCLVLYYFHQKIHYFKYFISFNFLSCILFRVLFYLFDFPFIYLIFLLFYLFDFPCILFI